MCQCLSRVYSKARVFGVVSLLCKRSLSAVAKSATTDASETLIEAEPSTQDMDLETPIAATADSKRSREDSGEDGGGAKKLKVEKSAEEDRLDQLEGTEGDKESDRVSVGPKNFGSSVETFDYFYKFLHYWPPNVNVNEFEQMVLLELLKKGHPEPEKKIGKGISAFQVRFHPQFKSRCFFIIRNDESVDDFSFRKCGSYTSLARKHASKI